MKNLFKKILVGAGITTIATATIAHAADVSLFSANYTINVDGKKGSAKRTLSRQGSNYQYLVTATAAGIASANQSSVFSLTNGHVSPISASTSYKIAGIGNTHSISFNSAKKQLTSTYKGKSTVHAMPRQAYDDLSMEIQIREELLNGKFTGKYLLVKKHDVEDTVFRRGGSATITTAAGTFDTIIINRIHHDKGRSTTFWLAPKLNYLPIKVVQVNDGKTMRLELTKVN